MAPPERHCPAPTAQPSARHIDAPASGDRRPRVRRPTPQAGGASPQLAPRLIDVHAKVFSALRHLGFREGEVKAVLSELRGDAELGGATVERWLREALCRIRPTAR